MRRWVSVVVVAAAACGDGTSPAVPDAPPGVDAPIDGPMFPACAEFDVASIAVPAHVIGTLGNADVQSPAQCANVDAPFGIESAGPDRVIPLRNLAVGTAYVVRLTSADDLAFYVATGCSTASGPAADQCALFQDGETGGREVGRFVAASVTAYVVVDFWASQPPSSLDFTLDVFPEQCQATGAPTCSGATPACFEGQCVGCLTSFDCTSAAAPVCGANQACGAGVDSCTADSASEPTDDGPAGATVIALDGLGAASLSGQICSSPRTEYDYYAFDVTTLGETWDFGVSWTGGRDVDLSVYDATGAELGLSFWEQPERIRLTYLPLGRYYVRVREFDSTPVTTPVAYTLTAQRTLGAACTAAADCAAEYRNQIFRGNCLAGSCVPISGGGAVAEGGACDSESDCGAALHCPSFYFVADGDTRETCSRACTTDAQCAAGSVCTTYFTGNFCLPACTEDDHCPTDRSTAPATGPWKRLSCDLPTGRCQP